MVGEDYKKPLRNFEKNKLIEIDKYINESADQNCIKNLHYMLLTFMKYYIKHDKGVLGIHYGEDVHSQMRIEDLSHVNVTYDHILKLRHDKEVTAEGHLKEAYDQATLPADKQSAVILKHRLERLDSGQLRRLRDMILLARVKEQVYDDLLPEPSYAKAKTFGVRKVVTSESEKAEKPPVVMPEKIFVIKREQQKAFKRLNDRFTKLFMNAYSDFRKFKESEIANFARTTQMTLQVSADGDIIK